MSPAFVLQRHTQAEWDKWCDSIGVARYPVPENQRARELDIETDSHADWRRANLGTDC
jgi:hypothetical protein